jgi:hypothetical protein
VREKEFNILFYINKWKRTLEFMIIQKEGYANLSRELI